MQKLIFMLFITLMVSCGDSASNAEENQNTEATQQPVKQEIEKEIEQKVTAETLKIIGEKVNIRTAPTSGKVISQVNTDDTFEIKDKSTYAETIGNKTDYWYQIEKDGNLAWVFGAFTSNKMNQSTQESMAILVTSFPDSPDDIDGCACSYSANKADFDKLKEPIYLDNFDKVGFMKINNKLIRFEAGKTEGTWTSEAYNLLIVQKDEGMSDSMTRYSGTITIKSNDGGKQSTVSFYGDCGC